MSKKVGHVDSNGKQHYTKEWKQWTLQFIDPNDLRAFKQDAGAGWVSDGEKGSVAKMGADAAQRLQIQPICPELTVIIVSPEDIEKRDLANHSFGGTGRTRRG